MQQAENEIPKAVQLPESKDLFVYSRPHQMTSVLQQKREAYAVEIRSNSREAEFQKKRKQLLAQTCFEVNLDENTMSEEWKQLLTKTQEVLDKTDFQLTDIPLLLMQLTSNDIIKKLTGVTGIRKLLSVANNPPIQILIDSGAVQVLIDWVNKPITVYHTIQAVWALANVASGTPQQTESIVEKGGIPLFVKLLSFPHKIVAEQAIWAIGNIAGDTTTNRDSLISCGVVEQLLSFYNECNSPSLKRHITWTLSNLTRGKPLPDLSMLKAAIPVFCQSILNFTSHPEILCDALWALSYLSNLQENIQTIFDQNVVPKILNLLSKSDYDIKILIPTLRTIGNLAVSNNPRHIDLLYVQGLLNLLLPYLDHTHNFLKRDSMWLLSNLMAEQRNYVKTFLETGGLFEIILKNLRSDHNQVRREAAWVLKNAAWKGNHDDVLNMIKRNVADSIIFNLEINNDNQMLDAMLMTLKTMLSSKGDEKKEQQILNELEKAGVIEKVAKLQHHPVRALYEMAFEILDKFYEAEVDVGF